MRQVARKYATANDDADLLIAQTTIEKARDMPGNITGENSEVIGLLWHYFDRNGDSIEVCALDRIWKTRELVNIRVQVYVLLAYVISVLAYVISVLAYVIFGFDLFLRIWERKVIENR